MTEQEQFIEQIGPMIRSIAFAKGYKYPSAIIAQACLESNYGRSLLSKDYNNFFGLKAGAYWDGMVANMKTKEEYTPGVLTDITASFRAYANMTEGINGYFDFIKKPRYANLLEATSAEDYLVKIKCDGYATSNHYVNNNMAVIMKYGLYKYDWNSDPVLDKAIETIALYVINKHFGNGHDLRKNMIYDMIRAKVNELSKEAQS